MRIVPVVIALALTSTSAFAEDEEHPHEHEHAHEHEHHHEHHVALSLGATTGLGDDAKTHFTLGADYEHRLPFAHLVGVGALVDAAVVPEVETLLAGFVALHPIGGLMVLGAIGVATTNLSDGRLGLRIGAAYFVPVGELSVGPVVSLDHVAGENAIVYGLAAGSGF